MTNIQAASIIADVIRRASEGERIEVSAVQFAALERAVTALEHQPEPQTEAHITEVASLDTTKCRKCGAGFPIVNGDYSAAYAHVLDCQGTNPLTDDVQYRTPRTACRGIQCVSCRTVIPDCKTLTCPRCGGHELKEVKA